MSTSFYIAAAASTLPFIGPAISIFNQLYLKNEHGTLISARLSALSTEAVALARLMGNGGSSHRIKENFEQLDRGLNQLGALPEEQARPLREKVRFSSLCGVIGSCASVAAAVSLLVMKPNFFPIFFKVVIPAYALAGFNLSQTFMSNREPTSSS